MSLYWRAQSDCGHSYDGADVANRVTENLCIMFQTCTMLHSSELRNNVLYVDVYEHEVNCSEHGKDTKVFVLFETTDSVSEHNFLRFVEAQLHNKSLNYNVKTTLSSLQFSVLSRADYMSVQRVHSSHLISHNGCLTDHVRRERLSHFF